MNDLQVVEEEQNIQERKFFLGNSEARDKEGI